MPLELSRLHSLRCGPYLTSVHVGDIPDTVAEDLGTGFRSVNLSRDSYEKIVFKHTYLDDFDFLQLPYVLRHGLWIAEADKPDCRIVCSSIPNSDRRYKAVVKKATKGPELWLRTFHWLKPRATRALLRRGRIVRPYAP